MVVALQFTEEMVAFVINNAGSTEYPHGKTRFLTSISPQTQKLIPDETVNCEAEKLSNAFLDTTNSSSHKSSGYKGNIGECRTTE